MASDAKERAEEAWEHVKKFLVPAARDREDVRRRAVQAEIEVLREKAMEEDMKLEDRIATLEEAIEGLAFQADILEGRIDRVGDPMPRVERLEEAIQDIAAVVGDEALAAIYVSDRELTDAEKDHARELAPEPSGGEEEGWPQPQCPPHGPWLQEYQHGHYQCQTCGNWFDVPEVGPAATPSTKARPEMVDRDAEAAAASYAVMEEHSRRVIPMEDGIYDRVEVEDGMIVAWGPSTETGEREKPVCRCGHAHGDHHWDDHGTECDKCDTCNRFRSAPTDPPEPEQRGPRCPECGGALDLGSLAHLVCMECDWSSLDNDPPEPEEDGLVERLRQWADSTEGRSPAPMQQWEERACANLREAARRLEAFDEDANYRMRMDPVMEDLAEALGHTDGEGLMDDELVQEAVEALEAQEIRSAPEPSGGEGEDRDVEIGRLLRESFEPDAWKKLADTIHARAPGLSPYLHKRLDRIHDLLATPSTETGEREAARDVSGVSVVETGADLNPADRPEPEDLVYALLNTGPADGEVRDLMDEAAHRLEAQESGEVVDLGEAMRLAKKAVWKKYQIRPHEGILEAAFRAVLPVALTRAKTPETDG